MAEITSRSISQTCRWSSNMAMNCAAPLGDRDAAILGDEIDERPLLLHDPLELLEPPPGLGGGDLLDSAPPTCGSPSDGPCASAARRRFHGSSARSPARPTADCWRTGARGPPGWRRNDAAAGPGPQDARQRRSTKPADINSLSWSVIAVRVTPVSSIKSPMVRGAWPTSNRITRIPAAVTVESGIYSTKDRNSRRELFPLNSDNNRPASVRQMVSSSIFRNFPCTGRPGT